MFHILHTSTVHKTASLADEGNFAYCQSSGAHNTKRIYKPIENSILNTDAQKILNTDAQARGRTRNILLMRTMP